MSSYLPPSKKAESVSPHRLSPNSIKHTDKHIRTAPLSSTWFVKCVEAFAELAGIRASFMVQDEVGILTVRDGFQASGIRATSFVA